MNVKELSITAILLSLVLILAPVTIPLGIVPLTLQTFIVPLAVCLLSRRNGLLLVVAYLLLGGFGLPVFAGWHGGWASLAGPTGGYLLGLLVFPIVIGLGKSGPNKWGGLALKVFSAAILQLVIGAVWLGQILHLSVSQALMVGVVPFILALVVKSALVVAAIRVLSRQTALNSYFQTLERK